MNRREALEKLAEVFIGTKIEGAVAAVLQPRMIYSQRYVVQVGEEMLDVHIMDGENRKKFPRYYEAREPLKVGDSISRRVRHIKPWADGQTIFQSSVK